VTSYTSTFGEDSDYTIHPAAYTNNGDGTITDRAMELTWSKTDSGRGLNWQGALAWVQQKNAQKFLGHDDWRLPSVKELQSLVDYTRSPDTSQSAAIDPLFQCTRITNEVGQADCRPSARTGRLISAPMPAVRRAQDRKEEMPVNTTTWMSTEPAPSAVIGRRAIRRCSRMAAGRRAMSPAFSTMFAWYAEALR